jgi:hypothetical protein
MVLPDPVGTYKFIEWFIWIFADQMYLFLPVAILHG